MSTHATIGLTAIALILAGASAPVAAGQSSSPRGQGGAGAPAAGQHGHGADAAPDTIDWAAAEEGVLANHRQLTFPDRYLKAGESYLSPDGARMIFQAVEVVPEGMEAPEYYALFVADVVRDAEGRISGLENHRRISPEGSANTCGWFHPTDPDRVLFATTLSAPTASAPPGYQRGTGRYRWMFPPEMQIVSCNLRTADGTRATLTPLIPHTGSYMAESSFSPDGRHVVYCSLESNQGDIFVHDLQTGHTARVIAAPGYDGGPFFSPDGRRLCYRSDRRGDNHLQIFVADLAFDGDGTVTGASREHQVTNNLHVNWCPFWTADGRHLLYATSQEGHHNYEVFVVDADGGDQPGSEGPMRYGTGARRVTTAGGADVLPAFSADGRTLIWTAQRGADGSSQLWAADFLMDLDPRPSSMGRP